MDFAAAAPYVSIEMDLQGCPEHTDCSKDAVFLSPHQSSADRHARCARHSTQTAAQPVPVVPGGGTVAFVNSIEHCYIAEVEHREEGGTPAIIESIRAGLVFQLKEAVGAPVIRAREETLLRRAVEAWLPGADHRDARQPGRRAPVDRVLRGAGSRAGRAPGRFLHHNFVVALLNDLFGVQSRGGCSCAGPSGHRLLGIDLERSHAYHQEISAGCEGIRPGWVRVNLNYFVSDAVIDYLIKAVAFVAEKGWRLLGDYWFDVATGLWHHPRAGPIEPPLRLDQVRYDEQTGVMIYPHHDEPVPESALQGYLVEAERIVSAASDVCLVAGEGAAADGVSEEFERLRWFELPVGCLRR